MNERMKPASRRALLVLGTLLPSVAMAQGLSPAQREEVIELLRQSLSAAGRELSAHELDWLLWTQSQALPGATHPYHLTPTIHY